MPAFKPCATSEEVRRPRCVDVKGETPRARRTGARPGTCTAAGAAVPADARTLLSPRAAKGRSERDGRRPSAPPARWEAWLPREKAAALERARSCMTLLVAV